MKGRALQAGRGRPRAGGATRIRTQLYLDGTSAALVGNEDFGTSPIFGQLSDKPLLASI